MPRVFYELIAPCICICKTNTEDASSANVLMPNISWVVVVLFAFSWDWIFVKVVCNHQGNNSLHDG